MERTRRKGAFIKYILTASSIIPHFQLLTSLTHLQSCISTDIGLVQTRFTSLLHQCSSLLADSNPPIWSLALTPHCGLRVLPKTPDSPCLAPTMFPALWVKLNFLRMAYKAPWCLGSADPSSVTSLCPTAPTLHPKFISWQFEFVEHWNMWALSHMRAFKCGSPIVWNLPAFLGWKQQNLLVPQLSSTHHFLWEASTPPPPHFFPWKLVLSLL